MSKRGVLTGRVRFRESWCGISLQVEYLLFGMPAGSVNVTNNNLGWRDADAIDLNHPKLRWLIDGPDAETREAG